MKQRMKQSLVLVMVMLAVQGPWLGLARAQNDEVDDLFNNDDEMNDVPPPGFNQPPPPPPGQAFPQNSNTGQSDFGNNGNPGLPGGASGTPPVNDAGFGGSTSKRAATPAMAPSKALVKSPAAPAKDAKGKTSLANASVDEITNENFPDLIESFDYPNAEITDVIHAISQLTGKNFIIDPAVRGKISIIAPTQITVAEAYRAFLAALAVNGFTVVPYGKFLKVKSSRYAQRDAVETYSGAYAPNADIYITRIVHLKHISSDDVNKQLRVLASKDGDMYAYAPTNSLIITDYAANVERLVKIIGELDKPGFEEQMAVIQIRHAKAKDLADLINQIINKDTTRGGGGQGFGGIPRFPRPQAQGGKSGPEELSLVANDDRTNAIIAVGNQAGIEKVKDLVKKLDYKLDPAEAGGVFVYYVRYGDAEKIATTLSGVTQGGSGGSSGGGGGFGGPGGYPGPSYGRPANPLSSQNIFGGDVKIVADKNTNSLVVTAAKSDWETVQSILQRIDIPRDQVYVEAIIMEMTSNKTNDWNPVLYYLDPAGQGVGRSGFSRQGALTNILDPSKDQGTILGFGTGGPVSVTIGGKSIQVPSILAFVQLIQTNSESNILSTPQILALDNEEAEIEVGDQVPISQDSVTTAAGVSSNTRFDKATIHLKLTPYIRPDSDIVRMKIDQQVKQPSTATVKSQSLAASTTIISDRTVKTNIVVPSGDTAVLGGLIHDQDQITEEKIPLLGDIPILGWLFRSKRVEKSKVNLVVFLTPKIIRNSDDNHNLLNRKANERVDWVKRNFGGRDPYGYKYDTLPRNAKSDAADTNAGATAVAPQKGQQAAPQSLPAQKQ